MKDLEIQTNRLLLRVPRVEDAAGVNANMNAVWRELQRWMSWAHDGENTIEKTKAYIASADQMIASGGLPLLGFCRETGRHAVSTGLTRHDDGRIETGYWVAKDFLGRGYATEATNALLWYAFQALRLKEVGIEYYEDNEKSRRVIEKLGFTFVRTDKKAKARCSDGALLDVHHYVMRDAPALPALDVRWRVCHA